MPAPRLDIYGRVIVFACGHTEPLPDYPEIVDLMGPLWGWGIRLHMPEGADCSECGPNTVDYWVTICRMINANAGQDWPVRPRPIAGHHRRRAIA